TYGFQCLDHTPQGLLGKGGEQPPHRAEGIVEPSAAIIGADMDIIRTEKTLKSLLGMAEEGKNFLKKEIRFVIDLKFRTACGLGDDEHPCRYAFLLQQRQGQMIDPGIAVVEGHCRRGLPERIATLQPGTEFVQGDEAVSATDPLQLTLPHIQADQIWIFR